MSASSTSGLILIAVTGAAATHAATSSPRRLRGRGPKTATGRARRVGQFCPRRGTTVRWINEYRAKPDPKILPMAVKAVCATTALNASETSGLYLGFIASLLTGNPKEAEALIGAMSPLPLEDHVALIKAIAYSDATLEAVSRVSNSDAVSLHGRRA